MSNAKDVLISLAEENIRELESENAKLRELVRYWTEVVYLTHIRYEDAEKIASKMSVIRQMMQELGIEAGA